MVDGNTRSHDICYLRMSGKVNLRLCTASFVTEWSITATNSGNGRVSLGATGASCSVPRIRGVAVGAGQLLAVCQHWPFHQQDGHLQSYREKLGGYVQESRQGAHDCGWGGQYVSSPWSWAEKETIGMWSTCCFSGLAFGLFRSLQNVFVSALRKCGRK